jgi:hypothetical protein
MKRYNMTKMVKLTNASQAFDGDDIYINAEIVASVFEIIDPDENAKLQRYTVVYGVNNVDWRVKESLEDVIHLLNN